MEEEFLTNTGFKKSKSSKVSTSKRKIEEVEEYKCDESSSDNVDDDDEIYSPPNKKPKKVQIINNELCSTLDRTRTSSRNACYMISKAPGITKDCVLSKSTLDRMRSMNREKIEVELKSSLSDWELKDKVIAMGFDTTASNTGPHAGACKFIEKYLERSLYWLACRHHIYELAPAAAFDCLFGQSNRPDISLFVHFKNDWQNIDKDNWKSGMEDPDMAAFIEPL